MTAPAADGSSLAAQAQAVATLRARLGAELIETHISWVLVAGAHAYKIKKAVSLGFLDFRTLASRRFYCAEELRLNRRTAPALYVEVLPLTGSMQEPAIGGSGEAIDWVLHMRAFAQHDLWDRLASRGALRGSHIDQCVAALCGLHDGAAVAAADDPRGRSDQVRAPLLDSLAVLPGLCDAAADRAVVDELRGWEAQAHVDLDPVFDRRLREGRVRECHGDLHLGNVTLVDGRTTLFDCLEFDAALRWTDVFSDVAFLAMDLQAHRLPRLAHRFVNAYVERSGDHDGLRVLRWYLVHRALVRAKVAALRAGQLGHDGSRQAGAALHHYLEVARISSRRAAPVLLLTHGCSGSGKTLATQSLLELLGAIRIRADVERKRLFGLEPLQRAPADVYGDAANEATRSRLLALAAGVLGCGFPVILDATFAGAASRDAARRLAAECGAAFVIIDFVAQADTLRARVRQRAARDDDASDAGLEVLEQQLARALPLRDDEPVWHFDADPEHEEAAMPARWAPLLERVAAAPTPERA